MKPLIVANWKCSPVTLREAKRLFDSIKKGVRDVKNVEVVICPPFVYLPILGASSFARQRASYGGLALGSQNCFWEEKGAFTGEVSPVMLKDLGCEYVIIGHSERRKYFSETDSMVNKKIKIALKNDLNPILCIDKISQIKKGIKGIPKGEVKKVIVAYEPLWAIGTGMACGFKEAKKFNFSIRKILGGKNSVLYGGSVNSQNAKAYIKEAGFQGLLVGGISLKAKEFVKVVKVVA